MIVRAKPWLAQTQKDWIASEYEYKQTWEVETATRALRDAAIARDPQKIRTNATRLCEALGQSGFTAPSPLNARKRVAHSSPIAEHQAWALESALADAIIAKDADMIRLLSSQVADALDLKKSVRETEMKPAIETVKPQPKNVAAVTSLLEQTKSEMPLEANQTQEESKNVSSDTVLAKAQIAWSKVEMRLKDSWSEDVRNRALEDAVAKRSASSIAELLESVDKENPPWIASRAEQVLHELAQIDGAHPFWSPCPSLSKSPCAPEWIPPSPWRSRFPIISNTATLSGLHTVTPLEHVRCPCNHSLNRVLPHGDTQRLCNECRRPCVSKCFVCPRCHHDPPCKHYCSYNICESCTKRKTEAARANQRRPCSAPRSRNVTFVVS